MFGKAVRRMLEGFALREVAGGNDLEPTRATAPGRDRPHLRHFGRAVVRGVGSVLVALATAAATSFFLTSRPDLQYSVPPTRPFEKLAIYHVEIIPSGGEVKHLRATVRFPNARIENYGIGDPRDPAPPPDLYRAKMKYLDKEHRRVLFTAPAVIEGDKVILGFLISGPSESSGLRPPKVNVRGDGVKATEVVPSRSPGMRAFLVGFGVGLVTAVLWSLIERLLRHRRHPGSGSQFAALQAR